MKIIMVEKQDIFPIGIGTFRIDLENKEKSLEGLMYSYNHGQNYIDTCILYEEGKVLEFLASFFEKIDREKIFVTNNITYGIEKLSDIEKQLDKSLQIMNLDYADCIQLHGPFCSKLPLEETISEMNRLIKIGKARCLGISNIKIQQLKQINSKYKLFIFEGLYNLECKVNEDIGIIDYCIQNNIEFTCYQPLRRNRTANRNYPLLVELSEKYNKTQNQILLNWLVNEKNIKPIIKSTDINNIKENIESLNFTIEKEDMNKLNQFRSKEFDKIEIDWKEEGGVSIDKLPNQFE